MQSSYTAPKPPERDDEHRVDLHRGGENLRRYDEVLRERENKIVAARQDAERSFGGNVLDSGQTESTEIPTQHSINRGIKEDIEAYANGAWTEYVGRVGGHIVDTRADHLARSSEK